MADGRQHRRARPPARSGWPQGKRGADAQAKAGRLEKLLDFGGVTAALTAEPGLAGCGSIFLGDLMSPMPLGGRLLRQAGAVRPSSQARRWKL